MDERQLAPLDEGGVQQHYAANSIHQEQAPSLQGGARQETSCCSQCQDGCPQEVIGWHLRGGKTLCGSMATSHITPLSAHESEHQQSCTAKPFPMHSRDVSRPTAGTCPKEKRQCISITYCNSSKGRKRTDRQVTLAPQLNASTTAKLARVAMQDVAAPKTDTRSCCKSACQQHAACAA